MATDGDDIDLSLGEIFDLTSEPDELLINPELRERTDRSPEQFCFKTTFDIAQIWRALDRCELSDELTRDPKDSGLLRVWPLQLEQ